MFALTAVTRTIFHHPRQVIPMTFTVYTQYCLTHTLLFFLEMAILSLKMLCFFWPALSCNFEDGLCGWYQDNSDNFDWTVLSGMDHTIGIGELILKEKNKIKPSKQFYICAFRSHYPRHSDGRSIQILDLIAIIQ